MLTMIPVTVAVIFPIVGKLKSLRSRSEDDLKGQDSYVQQTIASWDLRHRGRILCSGVCFALGIYDVVQLLKGV